MNQGEDPYFRFRDEVDEGISNCEQQTREWEVLRSSVQSQQRADWVKSEIQSKLEPIRKQIIDLEKMNAMILANPSKFKNITQQEVDNRRAFISKSRGRISQIESHLASPPPDTPEMRAAAKRDRVARAKIDDHQRAIDSEIQNQQVQLQRQDENLDMIGNEVAQIRVISNQIGDELRDQNDRLDAVNDHMDRTDNKIETVTQKMQKLLSSKTTWLWVACFVLTILLAVIMFLAFTT
ncbi:SNARE domain containing protein [Trichomonas vaginalis G3]|uniref:SNARE domain containing protein n=1 Tax=Trichomonas vaginalis (strain ATCC PRA-98 / G3) TaxID=412133 RepID=A2DN07_TRIV3|nr:SNAP receptor protein [Trichomonas vaginalis G3]EAY18184.1 SNARE domain containing protein [Trichomonas vaginalis G3]KAI5491480.1 SNAP receptor protein [Trichomonas vaginalis G3]|eukprot:XP_001579170.1 SNARE domain containing protein [Trichomonas vaginalis G3]